MGRALPPPAPLDCKTGKGFLEESVCVSDPQEQLGLGRVQLGKAG